MSCWVVPTIAAEYWRIPLEQVMDRIERNAVPVRRENGFTFIDILPDPPSYNSLPPEKRPATFTPAPAPVAVPVAAPVEVFFDPTHVSHNPTRLQTAAQRRAPVAA